MYKNLFQGEVADDEETPIKYSQDNLFRIKPQLVVFSKNEKDLKTVVNSCKKPKVNLTLTPRSAGTGYVRRSYK